MKLLPKTLVGCALALTALAGCQSSGPSTPAPGAGQVVAAAQMPEFCRSQAAQQMRANLEDLSTMNPVVSSTGTVVSGEWDSPDNDVVAPFQCRFDPTGVFLGFSRD